MSNLGRMFIRKVGDKAIIVSVIDYPEGMDDETLYTIQHSTNAFGMFVICTLPNGDKENIKKIAEGCSIDGLLTKQIWKT